MALSITIYNYVELCVVNRSVLIGLAVELVVK